MSAEIEKYTDLKTKLYQDLREGTIGQDEYKELHDRFNRKIAEARKSREEIESKKTRLNLDPQYFFVVTGAKQVVTDTSFEGDIPENMVFTGYLSDEEIKALMRHCKASIQPSFYEGFGIPPMEAMSVGADCIVSNASSLPEVYKNSVWYIDPHDYDSIDLDKIMAQKKKETK